MELEELDDWNCCGATAYMAVDEAKACVLASRNLAIAERAGNDELLAPCSACYLVLNKTQKYLKQSPALARVVQHALQTANMTYAGTTHVRHPLEILAHNVGLDGIKKRVTRPLKGLKVAPYYGCQIVRPYATFDDQYNPTTMDKIMEAIGASVVELPAQNPMLRREPDGHAAGAWAALFLHIAERGNQTRGGRDRDRLSAVPVQPRRLPRQDRGQMGEGAGADGVFHPAHRAGIWSFREGTRSAPGVYPLQFRRQRDARGGGGLGGKMQTTGMII